MNKRNLGLTARQKFGLQMLVAAVINAAALADLCGIPALYTTAAECSVF